MTVFEWTEIAPALPEILLACAAMVLLMVGVFRKGETTGFVSALSLLALAGAFVLVVATTDGRTVALAEMYVSDPFSRFVKGLVLLASAITIVISQGYIKAERMDRFEFPILILLATLGMCMMISANDLISLYMGIELQSLSLYVLAAFKRDSQRATEAGLKYFVLGALSSGLLLYGCSLIYGFTGTTNFDALAELAVNDSGRASLGLIVGIVFLTAGLAFKVSAVPFHMWTPDVYEGAPTPVTAFFAVAPKIAALALFTRAMLTPFPDMTHEWGQIVYFLAIASMVLGAFAAIGQTNIKRLMAYSSISHMGYALIGLAAGTVEGVQGILIYAAIYLAMNAGAFACILCMRRESGMTENIEDLAGLSRSQPLLAAALAIYMFSLAGIPLLAGFFAKLYIFIAAIDAGMYTLAVIGVLASVVGSYYYVRIVKIMYFDEPAEPFEQPVRPEIAVILTGTALFILLFWVYPTPLVASAQTAALALFP